MKNNAIKVIDAYKWNGMYVFDEPSLGITKEAFVGGSTELISKYCEDRDKVILVFSDKPFPGHNVVTELVSQDVGGSDYYCKEKDHKHWLCNVLLMYFNGAPKTIYAQIK